MTESTYIRSLRAIKPREVDLFQQRRDNGTFRDIPPVQELFERAIIAAWQVHQDGRIISVEAIHEQAPELTPTQIAELAESPYFQQALAARGIPYGDTLNRLTAEQVFALQVMTDPSIGTPVMQRLKRLNVSYRRWQGWLRQPVFAATYQRMIDTLKQDMVGPILTQLQTMAQGDVAAAKLALEIAGVYTPGASTLQEERRYDTIINALQEAIQLYVKDDATLEQIGKHVQALARGERPVEVVTVLPTRERLDSVPTGGVHDLQPDG